LLHGAHPDEKIDLNTGFMNWHTQDVFIPGNAGLDISISRSISDLHSSPMSAQFNKWSLEMPQIVFRAFLNKGSPVLNNHCGQMLSSVDIRVPGVTGFSPVAKVADGSSTYNTKYPYGTLNTYQNNWTLTCRDFETESTLTTLAGATPKITSDTAFRTNPNGWLSHVGSSKGFILNAPDETKYKFFKAETHDESPFRVCSANCAAYRFCFTYKIAEIENKFGQKINFNYKEAPARQLLSADYFLTSYLTSIETSGSIDDRVVEFEYTHNENGSVYLNPALLTKIKWDGKEVVYNYDLEESLNSNGGTVIKYKKLTGVTLPNGDKWHYTYNTEGSLGSVTTPLGATFSYTYTTVDAQDVYGPGSPAQLFRTTDHAYDTLKNTGTIYPPVPLKPNGGHDQQDVKYWVVALPKFQSVLKSVTVDGQFKSTYSDFDDYGNPKLLTEVGNDGTRITKYRYWNQAKAWNVGIMANEEVDGQSAYAAYFNSNSTIGVKYVMGGVAHRFTYHPDGSLASDTWHRNIAENKTEDIVAKYSNHVRGKPELETLPEGVSISRKINPSGTIAWEIDGNGNKTSYTYDKLEQIKSISLAASSGISTTGISWPNTNKEVITQGNKKTTKEYDALGREIKMTTQDSQSTSTSIVETTTYDTEGRISYKSFPHYSTGEKVGRYLYYDAMDRVLRETNSATNSATNTTVKYCYGSRCNGNRTGKQPVTHGMVSTDARGFEIVTNGRSYGDPAQLHVLDVYSQTEEATDTQDAKYIHTDMARDSLGRMLSVKQGGFTRSYEYNSANQLVKVTNPETNITEYGYDLSNNMISKKVGSTVAQTMKYNTLNQLNWEKLTVNGSNYTLGYDYDTLGSMKSITYPDGETVAFAPDALGRAKSVGSYASNIQYQANNMLKSFNYGDATQIKYTLSKNAQGLPETLMAKSGNQALVKNVYDYDNNNNVISIADNFDNSYDIDMIYDGFNRLVSAEGKWGSGAIAYDDMGNIKTKKIGSRTLTYRYGETDNLLKSVMGSIKAYSFLYDGQGNVIRNGTRYFTYDNGGHMLDSGGIDYFYDGNNKRTMTVKNQLAGVVLTTIAMYNTAGKLMFTKETTNQNATETTTNHIYLNNQLVAKKKAETGI
jgi:YD repeat-containing protein